MKVTYSDAVEQAGKDYNLIQKATEFLAGIVDPASEDLAPFFGADGLISAEWDCLRDDRGRATYTLKLSGLSVAVSEAFQPRELAKLDFDLRWRLRHMWSDLLAANSKAWMKRAGELVSKRD